MNIVYHDILEERTVRLVGPESQRYYHRLPCFKLAEGEVTECGADELVAIVTKLLEPDHTLGQLAVF